MPILQKAIVLSLIYGLLILIPANFTIFPASNFSLLLIAFFIFGVTAQFQILYFWRCFKWYGVIIFMVAQLIQFVFGFVFLNSVNPYPWCYILTMFSATNSLTYILRFASQLEFIFPNEGLNYSTMSYDIEGQSVLDHMICLGCVFIIMVLTLLYSWPFMNIRDNTRKISFCYCLQSSYYKRN